MEEGGGVVQASCTSGLEQVQGILFSGLVLFNVRVDATNQVLLIVHTLCLGFSSPTSFSVLLQHCHSSEAGSMLVNKGG